MRHPPERAGRKPDLASVLKVCPQCLGDLVARSDFSGDYYCCLLCDIRTAPRSRIGRLPELALTPPLDGLAQPAHGLTSGPLMN
jgi:hypothetical protein